MSAPARRSVSYLPGRWSAVVTGGLSLLTDLHLADPTLAACWEAGGSADAVLAVLGRPGQQGPPSFALVAASGDGVRLVVAGSAHAEVLAGRADGAVIGAGEGGDWSEQRLGSGCDVRLVAGDPPPVEQVPPVPLTSGIVLASCVFITSETPPLASTTPQDPGTPAGWDEPAAQESGVSQALPWRSSVLDADGAGIGTSPDEPAPDAAVSPPVPSDYAYPPPPPPAAPPSPAAPLVQAVRCPNGHPNPLHVDACRVCGSDVAPQQPTTVERPPLGVLRLSTGETVPLECDLLLGRAPFAVDWRSVRLVEVPSPNNDISRSHVRITLDGWQVLATDLGSTNGTTVSLPGRPAALLRPHDPFALAPGSVLSLADEAQARFDVR